MFTTSLERLEQIEMERATTFSDPQFQAWVKELNVSKSYGDPEPTRRGAEMTSQYNYTNKKQYAFLN